MKRFIPHRIATLSLVALSALVLAGCEIGPGGIESKIGIGPLKAFSLEAGPGGLEAKGPSAGPFKFWH